jgi:uncharacterized protein (DUF1697 family)
MPKYVAFLRAINVGGRIVKNTELQKIFASTGIADAETFIASGNVIFDSKAAERALVPKIEKAMEKSLGYEVRTFLRTLDDLAKVGETTPFKPARHQSAKAYVIGFLDAPLAAAAKKTVLGFAGPNDEFHIEGREVYWLSQTLQSESPVFKIPFDKRAGCVSTWRNINTVQRIVAKYGA